MWLEKQMCSYSTFRLQSYYAKKHRAYIVGTKPMDRETRVFKHLPLYFKVPHFSHLLTTPLSLISPPWIRKSVATRSLSEREEEEEEKHWIWLHLLQQINEGAQWKKRASEKNKTAGIYLKISARLVVALHHSAPM